MIGRRVVIAVKNLIGAMIKMVEEKISKLEANYEAMAAEIEKLKAELAEKDKNETVWLPKSGDDYSYIQGNGNISISLYSSISFYDLGLINMNAAFKPDTETQKHLRWYRDNVLRVQNKLMQLHELLCPDYFPDWWDEDECKWWVCYNNKNKCFRCIPCYIYNHFVVYFTEEAAEKACEILNREKFMME